MSLHCVRLRETALPRGVAAGLLAAAWVAVAASVPAAGASGPSARERWQPTPLFGGHVIALAQAASAPKVFYAGTEVAGIFRSDDGGETWSARNQSLTGDELAIGGAEGAAGLAVAPSDPNLVYAISGSGLLRSRDGGNTWTLLGAAPSLNRLSFRLSGSLLGAADDGLYESGDEGDSWTLLAFEGQYVSSALEDSRGRHALFVTVEPVDGLRNRVWKSTDGGASWQVKFAAEDNFDQLTPDPSRPRSLYMLGDLDMYRSVDEAVSTEDNYPDPPLSSLAVDPRLSSLVYVGNASGVYRSTDGGRHFAAMGAGLEADDVAAIVVDPTDPSRVYAGVVGLGVFRWNGEANRWDALNDGLPPNADPYGGQFNGTIALAAGSQILYAATPRGVYRLRLKPTEID